MFVQAETSSMPKWVPHLLLVVAVFGAYANVYDNALLYDDPLLITGNEFLKGWGVFGKLLAASTNGGAHVGGGFYRPMQMVLYFLIYRIDGAPPFFYHLLNVTLHAANACLVFLLGRRLHFHLGAAFFAALIWGLHPLHTEAIAYISGTADPLCTFFCLAGVILLAPDFALRKILAVTPVFFLALMSKESAVVFPALVVACIFLLDKERLHPKTYLRTWPLWAIAVAYSLWRAQAPGLDGPQSYDRFYTTHGFDSLQLYAAHFQYRVYTFLATLPAYARLLVWPTGLHMDRSFPVYEMVNIEVYVGFGMALAAAAEIIWTQTKYGKRTIKGLPLAWGLLWFAAAHFPDTGLIFPMNSQFLEHWMYVPSIGLFLGIAETVAIGLNKMPWPRARHVAAFAASTAALALAIATFEQNMVWHDPFSFYGNIFKYGEVSPRAHNNLALAYMEKGDYASAVMEFEKTISMDDSYPETRYNLALTLLQLPDGREKIPEAIADLHRAIEIDPNFYRAWESLANIYDATGEKDKATECRKRALEIYEAGK